jgi:RNA polymerase sigma factor (sigma-70 family)
MMTKEQETIQRVVMAGAHHDYVKGLNSCASFKLHDSAMGEDMVQDTFIKTWGYLLKGGRIEVMKAFLYHVLNNLIVDQYRKHKAVSLDMLFTKGFEPTAEDHKRLFNILDGKAVIFLIKSLPLSYQKVMTMRYVDDLSLKEISASTGQSKNAVSVQTHRGLEKLKVLYYRQ